jgi:hypothetical protein
MLQFSAETFNDLRHPEALIKYAAQVMEEAGRQDAPPNVQVVEGRLPDRLSDVPGLQGYRCPCCGAGFMQGNAVCRLDHLSPYKKELLTQLMHTSCFMKVTKNRAKCPPSETITEGELLRVWAIFGKRYRGELDVGSLKKGKAWEYVEGLKNKKWKSVAEYQATCEKISH